MFEKEEIASTNWIQIFPKIQLLIQWLPTKPSANYLCTMLLVDSFRIFSVIETVTKDNVFQKLIRDGK